MQDIAYGTRPGSVKRKASAAAASKDELSPRVQCIQTVAEGNIKRRQTFESQLPERRHVVLPPHGRCVLDNSRLQHCNEDHFVSLPNLLAPDNSSFQDGEEPLHMFGVFDGHAGDVVSKYCAAKMHENLRALLRQRLQGGHAWSYDVIMVQALKDAFTQTDHDLKVAQLPGGSGSTATVAIVGKQHIWLAHCGDSRAVLSSGGKTTATWDQKASREDERERVELAGGKVLDYAGGLRVMGMLACTRAIGDHDLQEYGVVPEPEVLQLERSPDDTWLILASDGLWDMLNNEDALSYAGKAYAKCAGASRHPSSQTCCPCKAANIAAQAMAKCARARGSKDDITVLVVNLQQECTCKATRGPHNRLVSSLQQQQQEGEHTSKHHHHDHHHHRSHSRQHLHHHGSRAHSHSRSHMQRDGRSGQARQELQAEAAEEEHGGEAAVAAASLEVGGGDDRGKGGVDVGTSSSSSAAAAAGGGKNGSRIQPEQNWHLAEQEKVMQCEPTAAVAAAGGVVGRTRSQLQKSDMVIVPMGESGDGGEGERGDAADPAGKGWGPLQHSPVVLIPKGGGLPEGWDKGLQQQQQHEEQGMAEGLPPHWLSEAAPKGGVMEPGEPMSSGERQAVGVSSTDQQGVGGLCSSYQADYETRGLGEVRPPPAAAALGLSAPPSSSSSLGRKGSFGPEAGGALLSAAPAASVCPAVAAGAVEAAPVLAGCPGADSSSLVHRGAAGGGKQTSSGCGEASMTAGSSLAGAGGGGAAAAWSPFKTGCTAPKIVARSPAAAAGQCASPRVCPIASTGGLVGRGSCLRRGKAAANGYVRAGGLEVGSQDRRHSAPAGSIQQQQQQLASPFDQPQQQEQLQAFSPVNQPHQQQQQRAECLSPFDLQQAARSGVGGAVPCQCRGDEQQQSLQELQAACRCHLQQQRAHEQQEQQHQQGESGDWSQQQWLSLRLLFPGCALEQQQKDMGVEDKYGSKSGAVDAQQQQQQLRQVIGRMGSMPGGCAAGGVGQGIIGSRMDVDNPANEAGQILLDSARSVPHEQGLTPSAGPLSPFQAAAMLGHDRVAGLWAPREGRAPLPGSSLQVPLGEVDGVGLGSRQGVRRPGSMPVYESAARTWQGNSLGEKRVALYSEGGEGEGVMGRSGSLQRRLSPRGSCGLVVGDLDGHLNVDVLIPT